MPEYPEYDATLELLAMLPRSPAFAPLDSLAEDLGLLTQSEVRKLIDVLATKGIAIKVWSESNRRVAAVAHGDWYKAKQLATKYVEARDAVNT